MYLLGLMTPNAYANKLNRNGIVICHFCKLPMVINENYVRKKSARNSKAKSYHLRCAKIINITWIKKRKKL